MCCFFTLLIFVGPRFAGLFAWLVDPMAFKRAFADHGAILPLLMFIFLPWTLLMYVIVAPGGIEGFDWVWLGLAVFIDVVQWMGGGYGNRYQIYEYAPAAANPSLMPPTAPPVPPSQAAEQPAAPAPTSTTPPANPTVSG
jgi:hypothetical protein